jgi:ribosomal-protein-alanine N-acetyltransferase
MGVDSEAIASFPFQIRAFRPSDTAFISEILRDAAEAAQWPSESYAQLASSSGGLCLVCEANATVIGFIAARQLADDAEILNIAVHRDFRRKGVATALFLAAADKFRRPGTYRLFLELRQSNRPARTLYEHLGFVPSGTRKSYYRDPVDDAVCMQKKLTNAFD